MPHSRPRYAVDPLHHILSHSPIAGIIGQRQSGKTTLTEALAGEYVTLDNLENRDLADQQPDRFLEGRKSPFVIDECQLSPPLFPALKDRVRKNARKGQFILTGSIRFTSRKVIRESLTGRIVNQELLPFAIAESYSEPLPSLAVDVLKKKIRPEAETWPNAWLMRQRNRFDTFLSTGGLPGICFFREPHVRTSRWEAHLETLLERDIRLLVNTSIGYRSLRTLLRDLALQQGLPVNLSQLSKRIGVSPPTIQKILNAMESMFLIRSLATESQSRPVIFLEDQGMATHLLGSSSTGEHDMRRGLFANLLPQFVYRPELVPIFFQYRTRSQARVDIAVKTQIGTVGFIPSNEDQATASAIASARSFCASHPGAVVFIAHLGNETRIISESIFSIPYPALLTDRG